MCGLNVGLRNVMCLFSSFDVTKVEFLDDSGTLR